VLADGRKRAEVISVCDPQQPVSVSGALALLDRALDVLTAADAGALPTSIQAEALLALERAEAKHTAARARLLTAFSAQAGYQADAQGSARTWLRWQARITRGAAAAALAWTRRLTAHPVIGSALAAGEISASWGRAICDWTDRLPAARRDDADEILVTAARAGADQADLAGLAEEMYFRSRQSPDTDPGDRFDDRAVWLDLTFRGAGRLTGDLTPGCAAAVAAVLDALGRKAGPEDTRSAAQRRHDALEEACRRLIAAGMLPGRAGQHRQLLVHISLAQLRGMTSAGETAWAAAAREHGWLTGPEADAAACDATVVPLVTGHLDPAALDRLVDVFLAAHGLDAHGLDAHGLAAHGLDAHGRDTHGVPAGRELATGLATGLAAGGPPACGCTCGGCTCPARPPLSPSTRRRLARALLAMAADTLSGPGGLAAWLRGGLDGGPVTSVSLPLDIGTASETIPVHLRRLVSARHPHCAFPGCEEPASVCDVHHLVPRADGGATSLPNLVNLCSFHHLVAVHRWGWQLCLNPDGTATATGPDGRVLHSHGPPTRAA
jgi:Domain of unknown function (DUF222)/HNH endonuclease